MVDDFTNSPDDSRHERDKFLALARKATSLTPGELAETEKRRREPRMWSDAGLNRWLKTAMASEHDGLLEAVVNLVSDTRNKLVEELESELTPLFKRVAELEREMAKLTAYIRRTTTSQLNKACLIQA